MASFFERSLGQLEQENTVIGTRFRRIDSDHFIAVIYVQGEKKSACRIWLDRGHIGDIAYFADDSGKDNTYNSALRVENDGYVMWFKPTMQIFSSDQERMTAQEASEYYWSMLMERLQ
jgi:predicted ATPase